MVEETAIDMGLGRSQIVQNGLRALLLDLEAFELFVLPGAILVLWAGLERKLVGEDLAAGVEHLFTLTGGNYVTNGSGLGFKVLSIDGVDVVGNFCAGYGGQKKKKNYSCGADHGLFPCVN